MRSDWRFSKDTSVSDLTTCLPDTLGMRVCKTTSKTLTIYDDFTWQIWRKGSVLFREDQAALQLWQDDETQPLACSLPRAARFWWQLPEGALADRLQEIIAVRAFLPNYACQITTDSLDVMNADEKIVTRIRLFRMITAQNQPICLAAILPLRGYDDDYARIIKRLAALDKKVVSALTLRQLVIESGLQVAAPTILTDFKLQAAEAAEVAVSRMAGIMLQAARQFEPGICADIDTEFVHQYRVNLRKTRSLIALFKKTFSPHRYQQLKIELKDLGQRTNVLRDLDVFLLDKDSYLKMLPEQLRPGLKSIFQRLKKRRTVALNSVVDALGGGEYRAQIEALGLVFQQPAEFITKQAKTPLLPLVCQKGERLYLRICTLGKAIAADTPDERVHEVRIECKKLRYLLELFSELFPQQKLKQRVRQLKKLQDNLGLFNDYAVQAEFLTTMCSATLPAAQAASVNGMLAVLYQRQSHERSLVEEHIAEFCSSAVREQFHQLFASENKEERRDESSGLLQH